MHASNHTEPGHGSSQEGPNAGPQAGHSHAHGLSQAARSGQARRLVVVLVLVGSYMIAEVVGAFLTGSLALFADAGHTLSDVASLILGLFAVRMAQRPATDKRTYGHTRIEILAALAQGVALVAVSIMIFSEAVPRLTSAPEVNGLGMMIVATGGLLVNAVGMFILNRGRQESLNIRGVWLHLATDALGSLGVIGAGALVLTLGWGFADPAIAIVISGLVLWSAWQLLRDAVDILMESAPGHLDVDEIRLSMAALPPVASVHDLHVWTIGNGEVSLSTHLVSPPGGDPSALLREVTGLLAERFSIRHTTVQIEIGEGADGDCEDACDAPALAPALP
jgi:cobalt-zinc-cadmium efflux system protein